MNTQTIRRILALQSTVVLILITPFIVSGAESTSYKLYTNFDEADASPLGSNSYSLQEAGGTWTTQPLEGSNFQIVTAPPASSSSSSSSSSSEQSVEQGSGTTGGGSGGGRRPPATPAESSEVSVPVQSSSSSTSSAESVTSDSSSGDIPLDANVVPTKPSAGQEPSEGGTVTVEGTDPNTGLACTCECPKQSEETHCAAGTFSERLVRIPVLIPTTFQNPIPSMFLLIVAYILGYFSRVTRSGEVIVGPETSTKSTKKK